MVLGFKMEGILVRRRKKVRIEECCKRDDWKSIGEAIAQYLYQIDVYDCRK